MRLADFIMRDMEPILGHWEAFAATLMPAAENMGPLALRDHAQQILQAVAKDLRTSQTSDEQRRKSLGQAPRLIDATETAAQTHAVLRARAGFNINQVIAEYRALRASVLRLWMDDCEPDLPYLDDVVRFNEAIDQALAESVCFFSRQVDQNRNLLLGMLGHDMRSPLQAIQMTAAHLAALNADEKVSDAAARLIRSGARMQALLDDLGDFNRTQLGLGINVTRTGINLADVIADELDEVRAIHPDRQIDLDVNGDLRGVWDAHRVQQIVQNLVLNAIKYGARDTPVRVEVIGDSTHIRIDVRNRGRAIEPATLRCMFNPLTRGHDQQRASDEGRSLGLGLYIANEIAKAHHGAIEARSDETETSFCVSLPRE
ncbi:HAMP domain-containing sensor histidine kinase [Burkholderia gladioli pv. gladioli]|uniref:histidine kinase n=1 Tax=Burkholderia gladioli TaxID=28095 RepID=A0A095F318_BURGA|nr:HAMP domain-containing sensor histidine kinase [Burkholderia gladioli]AJW99269.1 his Kinase A domain protein [Burkholderia gladioli]ASD79838.1 two-component sensor histidine kinase [Burkholderia gladioli pv. gladioli]AWY54918.1 two-component sensor histidine kinase [Burkholderia gladioli pv. gladioli]KGC11380.1 his Kinase A domain protein [Burkholderia gladioli]MDJ1164095.1 HAMP domain-containing sensor histidine kinase [Burkholderia gladioli pv. gladioli]